MQQKINNFSVILKTQNVKIKPYVFVKHLERIAFMRIGGLQKVTLLDFPGLTACLIFTQGCNYRCPYCHNSSLLNGVGDSVLRMSDIMEYLEKRKNLLDGVVITGGEPTLQSDLEEFISSIRSLGYKVKLDTNGTNPKVLENLLKKDLLDYVAMDIKNDFTSYQSAAGVDKVKIDDIKDSIEILENSHIPYEFRTTIVKEIHNLKGLMNIVNYLKPQSKYYLQNYKSSDTCLNKNFTSFTMAELDVFQNTLSLDHPNVFIR